MSIAPISMISRGGTGVRGRRELYPFLLVLTLMVLNSMPTAVLADRIKDIASIAGVRSNQLVGYGLVVGLNGSVAGGIIHQIGRALDTQIILGLIGGRVNAANQLVFLAVRLGYDKIEVIVAGFVILGRRVG